MQLFLYIIPKKILIYKKAQNLASFNSPHQFQQPAEINQQFFLHHPFPFFHPDGFTAISYGSKAELLRPTYAENSTIYFSAFLSV